ncbi:bifunctional RecB family nuclease/DEAD/DEAH box helicase [Nocardia grenadensis]|uniref:bifunctional RecB family nuclease/DEAD/DEAH box helicase n=1 Tax=Nocardia grenadensis TaxID=931537 RepID=UPI0007A451E0|nr:AAA domain-containing protein [Nocardia grenadensis]
MFVVGDRVVYGAADLVRAARCEFALLRALDAELGTVGPLPDGDNGYATADHARDGHAITAIDRVLGDIRQRYTSALIEIPRPGVSPDALAALSTAHTETLAALDSGAPAVRDPLISDGEVFASADLLTRTADGIRLHGVDTDGSGPVATALRITVAAALFEQRSVRVAPQLSVHSETGSHHVELSDTRPVYSARRQRVTEILAEHSSELLPVQWGDPRFRACHRCAVCRAARAEARDLLLVAGMDLPTRAALRAAGVATIDRLTTRTVATPEIPPRLLTRLRTQAFVQLRQEHSGRGEYVTADPSALDMLPAATPGDLALDVDEVAPGRLRIEIAARDTVRLTREIPLESPGVTLTRRHELRAVGRRAFTDILAALTEPLLAEPDLHIYHYTAAARTFLLHTAARLGFGEETVDVLLRAGTLVDLYPIFRGAFVAGSQTYALPAVAAVLDGTPADPGARTVLRLADRLRAQMGDPPVGHVQTLDRLLRETPSAQPSSTEAALAEFAARRPDVETEDPAEPHRVAALTSALLGYHRREQQTAWWAHIDRLTHPPADWAAAPGVMVADSAAVDTKWHIGPGDTVRRFLRITGRLAGPGLAPGTTVCVVYEPAGRAPRAVRTCGKATVLGCAVDTDFADTVRLEETLAPGAEPHDELPVALAPALPDPPVAAADAVEDIGRQLLVSLPAIPASPLFDLLTRRPPRLGATAPGTAGSQLPPAGEDPRAAISAALRDLDRSYLAVQAPTGTGRTAVLADVLAALVAGDNWRIGIVAPTVAPVENLLDAVVRAGVLPELVAKSDSVAVAPEWLILEADRYPRFLANAIRGCVVGGTPADFTDPLRIPRDSLDLLVIADANAFPLATTAAVSVSARNLLLTGDPAARYDPDPGPHPEPVRTPALTWPSSGHVTLPSTHGYFLGRTRRLHPRLSEALSPLYFDGRLRAYPPPAEPFADAVEPGITTVPVEHHGDSTASDAEAREVLHQIRNLLGQRWDDGTGPRLLQPHDIVVVSPYRAQVSRIRSLLARARFEEVLVGTPDLLRGREAAVVLLSLAASSPEDSPITVGALLSPALVHDAVGRARRRAVIVRSPLLTEFLPETLDELASISRFVRLENR